MSLAVALVVRVGMWIWITANGGGLVGDEFAYLARAAAFRSHDWAGAYGEGLWPPLHPLLLSLARDVPGSRLVGVIEGTLTAAPIFLLALRLRGRRAAVVASLIFGLYPVFGAYANFLWSEGLFSLLLASAAYQFVLAIEEGGPKHSVLLGVSLGLMGLVRSSASAYALGFCVLLLLAKSPKRAIVVGLVTLLIWSPWLLALREKSGHFALLSTGNGFNLYVGNHPHHPGGIWEGFQDPSHMLIRDFGTPSMSAVDLPARKYAVSYIRSDPAGFVARSLGRLPNLWRPDDLVQRHFEQKVFPWKSWTPALIWVDCVGHWLIVLAATAGLCLMRCRSLLVMILIAGTAFPLVSIPATRLNLPMLILLTVPAGIAIAAGLDWAAGKFGHPTPKAPPSAEGEEQSA